MNCHYCGAETGPNVVFCRVCGTRQKNSAQPEPVAVLPGRASVPVEPMAIPVPQPVPILTETAPVPVPQPAPVFNEQTFSWTPQSVAQPAAPAEEEPLFDFERTAVKSEAPKLQLPVKRSLMKMIFLSILTLGIYPTVIWSRLVTELNIAASRYDGKRTMSFFGMLMLSPLTLGIHTLVWFHKLCGRIGCELQRRSILYTFGVKDFWLWNMLLSFLCAVAAICLVILGGTADWVALVVSILGILSVVGPFIFIHKLMKSMNLINTDFNING